MGIAPKARILPVIVGGSGPASVSTAAAGIRYAASHGAQVIDLPFGIGKTSPTACDPVLQAAIAYALGRDVVLVASSGNASRFAGPAEPASCAGVLVVGGIEPGGSLWPGSTREPYVAVAAPGDHMVYVGRDGRYTTAGAGTSFSAALTAGAAARIRSRYPGMPWYQVALLLVLRMSSHRRRRDAMAASVRLRRDERPWSFGAEESDDDGEVPGYGRPPGYGPPPLWTGPPYDQPRR